MSGFGFAADAGFRKEVTRRVLEYFERTGLSPKGGVQMRIKTVVLLAWLATSYASLLLADANWWQRMLLCVSLALAMAGVAFSVQHDGNHGAYSKHQFMNRLSGLTLDILGGSSYVWRWKHNVAHHTYTHLHGSDSDIDVPFGRLSAAQPQLYVHRFQHYYLWVIYAFFVAYWHFFEDFKQLVQARVANTRFPRPRGWLLVQLIGGKLFFLGWAFAIPCTVHPWWGVLAYYAVTSALLSFILILVFQLAHSVEEAELPPLAPHVRRVPRPWAVHQVEATVDFGRTNRLLNWYVGGLNFQIEHHLFPRICHVHYPRIADIVERTCVEFGVRYTVHDTCLAAVRSHSRWLRRMGGSQPTASIAGSTTSAGVPELGGGVGCCPASLRAPAALAHGAPTPCASEPGD